MDSFRWLKNKEYVRNVYNRRKKLHAVKKWCVDNISLVSYLYARLMKKICISKLGKKINNDMIVIILNSINSNLWLST